ncbi:SusD-like starch-binding protein associating with outer membrane [Chitinophaga skermanii]|uniref:SusD-like starch-binding protein associating with outer membrane n=1 Tax=Chitinophaga skermanii TaxID=331697 RepID=A0A327QXG8_9BACT|nr:RagB/SusD family nutrient uptake outer membrane protein [Chitinophaga skermanii]RAJ08332.1 SusD-like starch-binding protein associating with outer membrane [Chitinophaga skermanii]
MKKLLLYTFIAFSVIESGCSKFTEVTPRNVVIPTTVADYEKFLNDILLADAPYGYNELLTDDVAFTDTRVTEQLLYRTGKLYLWMNETYKAEEDDAEWNKSYPNIYVCNLVLENLPKAADATNPDRKRLEAEAKVHRAYYHFQLAMQYGSDYQAATAKTDLAVPLVLKPDLEAKHARATVFDVYAQVLKDLEEAIAEPSFQTFGKNYVHPGKAAAYALLARVYFYMGNYSEAAKAANVALSYNNTILDYNTFSFTNPSRPWSGVTNKPTVDQWPENIFTKTNSQNGIIQGFMISQDLLDVLGEKDLRYVYTFSRLTSTGTTSTSPLPDYFARSLNASITVTEMMLINAEYLARDGKTSEAMTILNTIRKKRFKPADYTDLTATTKEEGLMKVLDERRRELMYHGLRLFDLKRLNREPAFRKELKRVYKGTIYTLPALDNRYLMEISPKISAINSNIVPNPR